MPKGEVGNILSVIEEWFVVYLSIISTNLLIIVTCVLLCRQKKCTALVQFADGVAKECLSSQPGSASSQPAAPQPIPETAAASAAAAAADAETRMA